MITYLLGLPGSGKTYYAVDRIYNNFSTNEDAKKDKKVTFKNCYTNINEFNFEVVDNVFPLDFDNLYSVLKECHSLYKAKETDETIVKFLEDKNLKDTLFVIDEAHNHFDKKDVVLVWWLSYHRHLYHEIILITQSLSLIEAKYKQFSEFFYQAKPQSLILDKRYFKYNVFCSSRLSNNSKSGTVKIKRNKEVFKLYKSGDSINTTNVILKFIFIAVVFLLFVFSIFYYFKSSHDVSDDNNQVNSVSDDKNKVIINRSNDQRTITITSNDSDKDYNELKFFKLSCSLSICNNDMISLPPELLKIFISNDSVVLLHQQKITDLYSIFYLETSKDFYNYLLPKSNKGNNNDENNKLSIFGNSSTSQ